MVESKFEHIVSNEFNVSALKKVAKETDLDLANFFDNLIKKYDWRKTKGVLTIKADIDKLVDTLKEKIANSNIENQVTKINIEKRFENILHIINRTDIAKYWFLNYSSGKDLVHLFYFCNRYNWLKEFVLD